MVPAGEITENTIVELEALLEAGDVVVDGGNSKYTDTLARGERLKAKGLSLVDAGTSGGVWGLEEGFSLMVGADEDVFARLEPIFAALAPEGGYGRMGRAGSGHYVKMIHNGIEYGLMQAYAEGFEILEHSDFELDLHQISEVWRHGSVIRSWLLDLAARALEEDPTLGKVAPWVEDSGEGRWTVEEAIELAVPAPVIASALFARFASRDEDSFGLKMLAALRHQFGGHATKSDS
jgi:6-phosphogluconate dehydrogenase